jgi:ATP-dependent Clp protease ATP-binding subunit ClpB
MEQMKHTFRPEFLNRLDEIIFFKPLNKNDVIKIIDIMVENLKTRLKDKNLDLILTQKAKDMIVDKGYDPVYGARPLKRFLQSKIEILIARTLLEKEINSGSIITVDSLNEELFVNINNNNKRS